MDPVLPDVEFLARSPHRVAVLDASRRRGGLLLIPTVMHSSGVLEVGR